MNINEYLAKYFTNLVSILTLAGMVFFGWHFYNEQELARQERLLLEERYARLLETRDEGELLEAGAYQLASLYKEQAVLAKELAEQWRDLAIERDERIKLKSDTNIDISENVEEQEGNDYEFLTKEGKNGYTLNELRIAGKDSPAIGYVLVKKDGKVFKKNYNFDIRVESVQLKDDLTGKIRVVSRAFLVSKENGLAEKRRPDLKQWKGEKFPLEISGGTTTIDPQEPLVPEIKNKGFIFWPMNLNAGLGLFSVEGQTESRIMGDVSLMGYGLSKRDMDWKLLNVGVNYSNQHGIGLHFSPFKYRPLKNTLTNTYIGPGYWSDGDKNQGFYLGIQVGL